MNTLSHAVLAHQKVGVVPPAWGVLGPKYTRTNIVHSGVQVSCARACPASTGTLTAHGAGTHLRFRF
jgi:hypothetical protein